MIQTQLKLRLNTRQEITLNEWLFCLTGVWNWALRKIELNAKNTIYFSLKDFQNLLANHSEKLGIPSHTLQGMLAQAHDSWRRCFKKLARKPKLKGQRRPLNSIPFPDPVKAPTTYHIALPGIGSVRFHKQSIPDGKIKCGRVIKRASGWYLCLFIDAMPNSIPRLSNGQIGIDPGFKTLLALSTGEKVQHPKELRIVERRLAQAQRGHRRKLVARLHERIKCQRKDRNHQLSRHLVSHNILIAFSKDHHRAVAHRFGKSVCDASDGQLRRHLSYKSLVGGTDYVEVDSRFSTKTCSICGALTGPTGLAGFRVRHWRCSACGTLHDRDINAARNTLRAGVGTTHEESYACA